MPRPKAKKIIVQFDDGTKTESDFENLTAHLQRELRKQPELFNFNPDGDKKQFLLLEWKDGWKEVMAVDSTCREINRYYVITRPEDTGRLSLNREDGYPELIEIGRDPLNLKQIGFVENHEIDLKQSDREGKKVDHFFSLKINGNMLSSAVEDFRKALNEEGIETKTLSMDALKQSPDIYPKIARRMGIRAVERQHDVLDFMDYLARNATQEP